MKREQFQAIVRHLLGAAGAFALAGGLADESMVAQASGALATLAAVGWSLWEKRKGGAP
jgi:hypothetical protein